MKNLSLILLLAALLLVLLSGCGNGENKPDVIYVVDTVHVPAHDTVYTIDTVYSIDTIIATDTIVTFHMQNRIDTLEMILGWLYDSEMCGEATVIADTYNFEIADDRVKVEVTKEKYNIWITLIDGDTTVTTYYINHSLLTTITDHNDTTDFNYETP